MDTWIIVLIVIAAIVVLAVLLFGGRRARERKLEERCPSVKWSFIEPDNAD